MNNVLWRYYETESRTSEVYCVLRADDSHSFRNGDVNHWKSIVCAEITKRNREWAVDVEASIFVVGTGAGDAQDGR